MHTREIALPIGTRLILNAIVSIAPDRLFATISRLCSTIK